MSEPQVFMPGDDDPLAQRPPDTASVAAEFEAPPVRPTEPPAGSVYESERGTGISNEYNKWGHYGLAIGIVSALGTVLVYTGNISFIWPIIGGLVALYFGIRGHSAARRNFATNGGQALTGAILGALSVLGSVAYFVLVVLLVVAIIGSAG